MPSSNLVMKMVNNNSRRKVFQYLATATSSLNILTSGLHSGWTSIALTKLLSQDSDVPTTNDEGSWIAVGLLFGTISGAILASIILDRIGRKNVILLSAALFFISWIILASAPSAIMIIIARFLAGIPDGLTFCSVPVYIAEVAEPGIRGLLGSSVILSATAGVLLMNVVGSYLSITTSSLIAAALPLTALLTFVWMPESPYYLLMKGNVAKARRSLQLLRGTDNVEQELIRIKTAVDKQNKNTGKFLDLFTVRSNRKGLYIMMGARAASQLSGITAVMFYAQVIFKEFANIISPVISSTIYFSMQVVFAGLSSLTVDKVGRRPLMIISIIGVIITLLTESCYFFINNTTDIDISRFSLIPVITLIVFVIVFNIGMQTIPILLISEIFPTNVKAFAFCLNDIYYCVVNIILSKFFQFTKDEFGLHIPFLLFALFSVMGLLFLIFCIPETKGKTLEEIQEELQHKPIKNDTNDLEMRAQK